MKSKIKLLTNVIPLKGSFLASRQPPSHCVLMWWKEKESEVLVSLPFLGRTLIPSWELHLMTSSNAITSQRHHFQIPSHQGLGVQRMNFSYNWNKHSVYNYVYFHVPITCDGNSCYFIYTAVSHLWHLPFKGKEHQEWSIYFSWPSASILLPYDQEVILLPLFKFLQ